MGNWSVVVVFLLEHSHNFTYILDNHSTVSDLLRVDVAVPRECSEWALFYNVHCGLVALYAGATRCCDHASSVEKLDTSGLAAGQTIQSDEMTSR